MEDCENPHGPRSLFTSVCFQLDEECRPKFFIWAVLMRKFRKVNNCLGTVPSSLVTKGQLTV